MVPILITYPVAQAVLEEALLDYTVQEITRLGQQADLVMPDLAALAEQLGT
jgi:hypothetical protein